MQSHHVELLFVTQQDFTSCISLYDNIY